MVLRDSYQRDVAAVELFLLISALGVVLHSWYGEFCTLQSLRLMASNRAASNHIVFFYLLLNICMQECINPDLKIVKECSFILIQFVVQRVQRKLNHFFIGDNNQTCSTIQLCWCAKVDTIRSIILQQSKCPYDPLYGPFH